MILPCRCCSRSVVLLALLTAGCTPGTSRAHQLEEADSLFRQGHFADAEARYRQLVAREPANAAVMVTLGRIALLGNRLAEAEQWLGQALATDRSPADAARLLAEVHYRRDDFSRAAPLLGAAGKDAKAAKLASFGDRRPYRVTGPASGTRLPFATTDPLPVVPVRVNGSPPVYFLIDTGGGETILDPEFAASVGARRFGVEQGRYAGDMTASFEHGAIDSLALGELMVHDLPVHLLPTRRMAAAAGGRAVEGILGTVLLYHFLATLDYAGGVLHLRPRSPAGPHGSGTLSSAAGAVTVPFWLAGDHYIVAWGRVNAGRPMLLFVDTGLAGNAFTCPRSTVDEMGIQLREDRAVEATGPGGPVRIVPFRLDSLSLGDATRTSLTALFGPFPESLEYQHGFRIGGLISHAFFRPYAVTFDFAAMQIVLEQGDPR